MCDVDADDYDARNDVHVDAWWSKLFNDKNIMLFIGIHWCGSNRSRSVDVCCVLRVGVLCRNACACAITAVVRLQQQRISGGD